MFRFECFWQFFFFQKIKRKDFAQKKVAHFMELTFYFVTLRHRPFVANQNKSQVQIDEFFVLPLPKNPRKCIVENALTMTEVSFIISRIFLFTKEFNFR